MADIFHNPRDKRQVEERDLESARQWYVARTCKDSCYVFALEFGHSCMTSRDCVYQQYRRDYCDKFNRHMFSPISDRWLQGRPRCQFYKKSERN